MIQNLIAHKVFAFQVKSRSTPSHNHLPQKNIQTLFAWWFSSKLKWAVFESLEKEIVYYFC